MHSFTSISGRQIRIQNLRNKILDGNSLPFAHQNFNIIQLLKDQQSIIDRINTLQNQINSLSQQRHKSGIKSKSVHKLSKPASVPIPNKNSTIKYRNEFLKKEITRLRKQNEQKMIQKDQCLSKQKEQIDILSQKIDELHTKKQMLLSVVNKKSDMFELYEKMCRKCETKRRQNDQISQQIKKCILQMNELTGSQENPNFFLMKFK